MTGAALSAENQRFLALALVRFQRAAEYGALLEHWAANARDGTRLASYVHSAYVANKVRFEWNPKKAAVNLCKHGVSFEDAQTVFADEIDKLIDDPDHSEEEDRFVLLGLSSSLRLLVVCHCCRAEGNVLRIISARKAEGHERNSYP